MIKMPFPKTVSLPTGLIALQFFRERTPHSQWVIRVPVFETVLFEPLHEFSAHRAIRLRGPSSLRPHRLTKVAAPGENQ